MAEDVRVKGVPPARFTRLHRSFAGPRSSETYRQKTNPDANFAKKVYYRVKGVNTE